MLPRLLARHPHLRLARVDGGYAGRPVDWARTILRLALDLVRRSDDAQGFTVLPGAGAWNAP
jgi:hypothetical protein